MQRPRSANINTSGAHAIHALLQVVGLGETAFVIVPLYDHGRHLEISRHLHNVNECNEHGPGLLSVLISLTGSTVATVVDGKACKTSAASTFKAWGSWCRHGDSLHMQSTHAKASRLIFLQTTLNDGKKRDGHLKSRAVAKNLPLSFVQLDNSVLVCHVAVIASRIQPTIAVKGDHTRVVAEFRVSEAAPISVQDAVERGCFFLRPCA